MHPHDIALLRAIRHSADELLASGGDSRLLIDAASGLGKYGCATRPRPDTLAFGSCTASSVSTLGYAAACRLHQLCRRVRRFWLPRGLSASVEELEVEVGCQVDTAAQQLRPTGSPEASFSTGARFRLGAYPEPRLASAN